MKYKLVISPKTVLLSTLFDREIGRLDGNVNLHHNSWTTRGESEEKQGRNSGDDRDNREGDAEFGIRFVLDLVQVVDRKLTQSSANRL